jgi:hypothetical protein
MNIAMRFCNWALGQLRSEKMMTSWGRGVGISVTPVPVADGVEVAVAPQAVIVNKRPAAQPTKKPWPLRWMGKAISILSLPKASFQECKIVCQYIWKIVNAARNPKIPGLNILVNGRSMGGGGMLHQ